MKYTKDNIDGLRFLACNMEYVVWNYDSTHIKLHNLSSGSTFSFLISDLLSSLNSGDYKVKNESYEIY